MHTPEEYETKCREAKLYAWIIVLGLFVGVPGLMIWASDIGYQRGIEAMERRCPHLLDSPR